jgi:hypothetical protein
VCVYDTWRGCPTVNKFLDLSSCQKHCLPKVHLIDSWKQHLNDIDAEEADAINNILDNIIDSSETNEIQNLLEENTTTPNVTTSTKEDTTTTKSKEVTTAKETTSTTEVTTTTETTTTTAATTTSQTPVTTVSPTTEKVTTLLTTINRPTGTPKEVITT